MQVYVRALLRERESGGEVNYREVFINLILTVEIIRWTKN